MLIFSYCLSMKSGNMQPTKRPAAMTYYVRKKAREELQLLHQQQALAERAEAAASASAAVTAAARLRALRAELALPCAADRVAPSVHWIVHDASFRLEHGLTDAYQAELSRIHARWEQLSADASETAMHFEDEGLPSRVHCPCLC
jgi:hypothetical protein